LRSNTEIGEVCIVELLAVTVPPLVAELAVVMIAAAAIAYAAGRLGLVPMVGFIVAGALVGPNALGVVSDVDLVTQTAEIGVIFLLFGIGLELSVDHLKKLGSLLLGGGLVQVAGTVILVTLGCLAFGVDAKNAIFTGCLVSLSSTALVLKLLSSRRETNSPVGEVSVAFLIFQDLAVVLMVLFVPMLGGASGGGTDIAGAVLKAIVVMAFIIAGTRFLIPRSLDAVAERASNEVFLLTVAAFALVVAYLASVLGLTDSLGAFIAGLVISSSRHRERALRYVTPFQMLFSAVFFASIGMLLDPRFVIDRWQLVVALAAVTVIAKVVTAAVAARMFHRSAGVAVTAAFLLAQLGEFAFVLEQTGRTAGLSPAGVGVEGSQAFIATAVLLFVLTPLLDFAGRRAGRAVAARLGEEDLVPTAVAPVLLLGADEATTLLVGSALETAGQDSPVASCELPLRADLPAARLIVAFDLPRRDLLEVLDAAARHHPPTPTLAWVSEPNLADELSSRPHVQVIDAAGSAGVMVTLSVLKAIGVDSSLRGDAITAALAHLPGELRRPLA
jgi:monovalent cation:H+ antiporter-2, CPA2 family